MVTVVNKNIPILNGSEDHSAYCKPTLQKITVYVVALLAKIIAFVSALIPPIGLSRIYNYFYNLPLNEGINQAQLEKYSAVMNQKVWPATHKTSEFFTNRVKIKINREEWLKKEGLTGIPVEKVDSFFQRFENVLTNIARGTSQTENIRYDINDLVKSTVYQHLKYTTRHPAIQLLKNLTFSGTTADAAEVVQAYGAKVSTDQPKGKSTLEKLARDVDTINSNPWCFNRNSTLSKAWWGITHLSAAWHSLVSTCLPKEYNSEKHNPIFQAGTIKHPGSPWKSTPLTLGPTPTQPLYFDAHLPYLKENNMCEIRVIMQDTNRSEGIRVEEFYKKTERYRRDGTLALITLPFDMEPMEHPAILMGENFTLDSFLLNYAKFILAKDGIADKSSSIRRMRVHPDACRSESFSGKKVVRPIIPENLLSDEDLKACFTSAKDIFHPIFKHVDLNQKPPKVKAQIATTLQLVTQALMIFSALDKVGEGSKEIASLCIHCKQCIDRAVVLIAAMIMLDYIPTAKETNLEADLPDNLVNLVHGIVVGRPEIVDKRLGIGKRVEVLSNFLHVLGGANFADLKASTSAAFRKVEKTWL